MIFANQDIQLIALRLDELYTFQTNPAYLLKQWKIAKQEVFNPDFLQEITTNWLIPNVERNLEKYYFHTKWLAIKRDEQMIVADFLLKNGLEDDQSVEIGYGVYPNFEGKGLMTSVLACFIEWAKTQPEIKFIKAETERENMASIRVLEKNFFEQIAENTTYIYWELEIN